MLNVDGETRIPFILGCCRFGEQSGKVIVAIMYDYPITLLKKKGE